MPNFSYMTELVPKSITLTDEKLLLSDQAIVNILKTQNPPLFLRIVDFYAQLKIANQRTSEGKETCNVKVRWETQGNHTILPVGCLQIRYLLSIINVNNPFGRVVELSARYLQDLKFYNNSSKTGFSYKKKFT
tara:strand:- start:47 stop:445 length:399 start_codon:yes stop_codon:yes gene_type:complete